MTDQPPARRPRGRPKVEGLADQRRTQIIEAAFEVLTERGYHGTSIAEIAQQAGIGQGTVYRYVSSKRELLDQVFDWAVERAFATVDPNALLAADPDSAQDMVTQIGVVSERLYAMIDKEPAMLKLIGVQASAIDKELKARVVGLEAMINSMVSQSLTRAIDKGWLELSAEQKPIIARLLMMMAMPGLVRSIISDDDADKRAQFVSGASDIAFHGLMKRGA
ncbi:TetR/AcrR family transcriptional regulator [Williamsia sp. 1135]|uniref:TetR/AcrR family transcriptional regulator n=1 Tax=Williamsia sp. 1135 TaxID=1889262 RepID=UPI000A1140F3|nr:TetR/AcrR family transcriptional regulator [Williamsia sp. 1135]ORM35138.1 hypothetical protein BFL43_10070 [Williamsia sp. 1135]